MVEYNSAETLDVIDTYSTDVMTGGSNKRMYLYNQLVNSLKRADSVDIIVSFLMESGVKMLIKEFENALQVIILELHSHQHFILLEKD